MGPHQAAVSILLIHRRPHLSLARCAGALEHVSDPATAGLGARFALRPRADAGLLLHHILYVDAANSLSRCHYLCAALCGCLLVHVPSSTYSAAATARRPLTSSHHARSLLDSSLRVRSSYTIEWQAHYIYISLGMGPHRTPVPAIHTQRPLELPEPSKLSDYCPAPLQ